MCLHRARPIIYVDLNSLFSKVLSEVTLFNRSAGFLRLLEIRPHRSYKRLIQWSTQGLRGLVLHVWCTLLTFACFWPKLWWRRQVICCVTHDVFGRSCRLETRNPTFQHALFVLYEPQCTIRGNDLVHVSTHKAILLRHQSTKKSNLTWTELAVSHHGNTYNGLISGASKNVTTEIYVRPARICGVSKWKIARIGSQKFSR